jgi:hypothetical protein
MQVSICRRDKSPERVNIAGFLTDSRVHSAKQDKQVAQPDCNPKQEHTTKTNHPATPQEVVVLSNKTLLQIEKNSSELKAQTQ